jgi:hypothetical protein
MLNTRMAYILLITVMSISFSSLQAQDFPHSFDGNGIGCFDCHDIHGTAGKLLKIIDPNPPESIEDTPANNLCWSCHNDVIAPFMRTHSSISIDNGYGDWAMECRTCHNPHFHPQQRFNAPDSYLTQKTITSLTSTVLTSTGAGWTVDEFAGLILFPDLNNGNVTNRILSNTEETITVEGEIHAAVASGASFAVGYGKLIHQTINAPDRGNGSDQPDTCSVTDNVFSCGNTFPRPVKFYRATDANSFADPDDTETDGPCQVCHSRTTHFRFDGTGSDQWHTNVKGGTAGLKCTEVCHQHKNGFAHGGSGVSGSKATTCIQCHGHENGTRYDPDASFPYTDPGAGGDTSYGAGTTIPHSTHTESWTTTYPPESGADDQRGPGIYCDVCHDTDKMPSFKTGADSDGNGIFSLAETDVCDVCHSPDGAYDGVNDPVSGAKNNWHSEGVYAETGTTLKVGKEKWCVGCHDQGIAIINARQAPDIAGNDSTYGFYASGHGAKAQECQNCHDITAKHNFDGQKSYRAALDNYQASFRLKDVDGQPPLNIPLTEAAGCEFDEGNYRLCLTCHASQGPGAKGTPENLLNDTRSKGMAGCGTNPYKNSTVITTGFRNNLTEGFHAPDYGGLPANGHWDHLVDASVFWYNALIWRSDETGTANSRLSCPACHNPHGDHYDADTPTVRMTRGVLAIRWGTNSNGDYGVLGSVEGVRTDTGTGSLCANSCHDLGHDPASFDYYRDASEPILSAISVVDTNSSDPKPAEAGYTNNSQVEISFSVSGGTPIEMNCAEDSNLTINSTGWINYTPTHLYTLSDSDGAKTVSCLLRSGSHSDVKSAEITLDRLAPSVAITALSAPNGSEVWKQDAAMNITWSGLTDINLKSNPIGLAYSTDSGNNFLNSIITGISNSGSYAWSLPGIESAMARVQLSATDRAGNMATDRSDADFTIEPVVAAVISGITLSDNNSTDPSAADTGYTNSRSINVAINGATYHPTHVMVAEDVSFTLNSTGWLPYDANVTYSITDAGDGSKTVYSKVRNILGTSATRSAAILLDTVSPTIQPTTLIAPNGGEFWLASATHPVTWSNGDITDDNLKANPISIGYSPDGGSAYSWTENQPNSGLYSWSPAASMISHQGVITVRASDMAGNIGEDSSDNHFYLTPPSNYIVINTNDSGAGSLRQAIADLELAGGNSTIWFNIPLISLTNGTAVIEPATALPTITQTHVTIDGGSQTSIKGDTNTNGREVRLDGNCNGYACLFDPSIGFSGLNITGSDAIIKEMQFTEFLDGIAADGDRATLLGNHIGFASDSSGYASKANDYGISISGADVTVGGPSPADRNYVGCSFKSGMVDSGQNTLITNNAAGLRPDMAVCLNGYADPVSISLFNAQNPVVQGNIFAATGIGISLSGTTESASITGNTFGTYYDSGVWTNVTSGPNTGINTNGNFVVDTMIGGPNIASSDSQLNDSNVFNPGGNGSSGTAINLRFDMEYSTKVYGNFIGINPELDEVFTGSTGVRIDYVVGATIGGGETGEAGNVITNMTGIGVTLQQSAVQYIRISRNSFYNNGDGAGDDAINLALVTNNSITRPVINTANTTTVNVGGLISGDIVEVYIAEFSGTEYGEGKTFIGSAVASGSSVDVTVSGVSSGQWVTATRTNDHTTAFVTSAFSANALIP